MHRYSIIYMLDVVHMAIKLAISQKKLNKAQRNHVVGQCIEVLKTLGIEVFNDPEDQAEEIEATDENFMRGFLDKLDGIEPDDVDFGKDT